MTYLSESNLGPDYPPDDPLTITGARHILERNGYVVFLKRRTQKMSISISVDEAMIAAYHGHPGLIDSTFVRMGNELGHFLVRGGREALRLGEWKGPPFTGVRRLTATVHVILPDPEPLPAFFQGA